MVVSTVANTRGLRVGDTKGDTMDDTSTTRKTVEGGLLIVEIVQERSETALGHHVTLGA